MGFDPNQSDALRQDNLALGYHPKSGVTFWQPELDRFAGTYVLGLAGSGKTSFLENDVFQDIQKGHAVIFVDPHGDVTKNIIAGAPPAYLPRIAVLDLDDEDYPFSINLFAVGKLNTSSERGEAVDRIVHVFEILWPEVAEQQLLQLYVGACADTLLDNPGSTMLDMLDLLTKKDVRHRLLARVSDPTTLDFWAGKEALGEKLIATETKALTGRLNRLFMGRPLIRNILGQRKSSISFRKAIENKEVILVKLPVTTNEKDATTIGAVIVAQVTAAIFSFRNVPEDERPGVSLFVDEFQNFASQDFERVISQARKFKARLILAHQQRGQVPEFLQRATMGTRTKICFQADDEGAKAMAPYFPPPDDGRLDEVEAHLCAALLKDPGPDKYVRWFTDQYLRPLQSQRKSGKVSMGTPGLTWESWAMLGLGSAMKEAQKAKPILEEDPTQYVDDLLRDVMQRRNPNLSIPPKAVIGFANCGRGFYKIAKDLKPGVWLEPGYPFPDPLVISGRWVKVPATDVEQLLHFIYTLRHVMQYFAEHPVGKKAPVTTAAVAQLLTQLPKRQALVRCGDDVGRIHTFDTPPKVTGAELDQRLIGVRDRTRAKYCHPRAELERSLRHEPEPTALTASSVPTVAIDHQDADEGDPGATRPVMPVVSLPKPPTPPTTVMPPVVTADALHAISGWGEADEP